MTWDSPKLFSRLILQFAAGAFSEPGEASAVEQTLGDTVDSEKLIGSSSQEAEWHS